MASRKVSTSNRSMPRCIRNASSPFARVAAAEPPATPFSTSEIASPASA